MFTYNHQAHGFDPKDINIKQFLHYSGLPSNKIVYAHFHAKAAKTQGRAVQMSQIIKYKENCRQITDE